MVRLSAKLRGGERERKEGLDGGCNNWLGEVGERIPTGGVWSVPGRGIPFYLSYADFKITVKFSSGQPFAPGREQRCL